MRVLTYVTPETEQEINFKQFQRKIRASRSHKVLNKMSFMEIYVYLVERRSKTMSDRQQGNFKSLKGYSYFASGWIENMWITKVEGTYCYIRGNVYQSCPSSGKCPYEVYVSKL